MSKLSQLTGVNINLLQLIPKSIQQAIVDTALNTAKTDFINQVDKQFDTYIDVGVLKTAVVTTIASWQIKV